MASQLLNTAIADTKRVSPSIAIQSSLRVMSYNMHYGVGKDGVCDINRIAHVIKESGADIIGLNEVDNQFSERSAFANQIKQLSEKLRMYYVFGPTIKSGVFGQGYGNAILSRFKLYNIQNYPLFNNSDLEPRACLSAVFSVDGKEIKFFVTHLNHKDSELRKKQLDQIMKIASSSNMPSVITGDFNQTSNIAEPNSEFWGEFRQGFYSAFDLAGTGEPETFYGKESKIIDFVFLNRNLADSVRKSYVFRTEAAKMASDHLPLIAEMVINKK